MGRFDDDDGICVEGMLVKCVSLELDVEEVGGIDMDEIGGEG